MVPPARRRLFTTNGPFPFGRSRRAGKNFRLHPGEPALPKSRARSRPRNSSPENGKLVLARTNPPRENEKLVLTSEDPASRHETLLSPPIHPPRKDQTLIFPAGILLLEVISCFSPEKFDSPKSIARLDPNETVSPKSNARLDPGESASRKSDPRLDLNESASRKSIARFHLNESTSQGSSARLDPAEISISRRKSTCSALEPPGFRENRPRGRRNRSSRPWKGVFRATRP